MDLHLMLQFGPAIQWRSLREAELDKHDKLYVEKWSKIMHRGSDVVTLLPKPPCEIRPSPIHGMGVFATRDIPAESYITMYPADGVSWQPDKWNGPPQVCLASGWKGTTNSQANAYRQGVDPIPGTRSLAIIGNPALTDDCHFLGHMINDGACCKRKEASKIYEKISNAKANCEMCVDVMTMASTRDIKAGEEILTSYGVDCWLDLNWLLERNL